MYAFEFLVGPYAVAHLRLTQEILSEGGQLPDGRLQIYLADTLESPFTTPPGALDLQHKPLVEERRRARAVKEKQNILVCIGNPPYDRQTIEQDDLVTQRKGGWVRFPDEGQGRPILEDFLEPARAAGQAVHLKNLYNDYVYFWRWGLWKLFEHQNTGGVISFITASSYLSGPGFIGMREVMRRTFDELWIINLEGDNLGARKTENVFNIQTPVAIAIGVCKGKPNREQPARVHYTKLTGTREQKLDRLDRISSFSDLSWQDCPTGWHDRFLPASAGDFVAWPKLAGIFPWQFSGLQFKRRWPIGENESVLTERWLQLVALPGAQRAAAFVESRDRDVTRTYANMLPGSGEPAIASLSKTSKRPKAAPYAFRSFDRQVALLDTRLGDYLRPDVYAAHSNRQLYLSTFIQQVLGEGPAAVVTELLPDLHHFRGSFGGTDMIAFWRDAASSKPNITDGLLPCLKKEFARSVTPEDLFAYVYGILANPGYVERFWEELGTPGPRVPITKNAKLFTKIAGIGRELIWLHTFGNRLAPQGKQLGDVPQGSARWTSAIPEKATSYPEELSYDPKRQEIVFGDGRIGPVDPKLWEFEISGMKVVQSWLAYRRRSGAGKRSSELDKIRPRVWDASLTDQFLELIWVLEHTIAIYNGLQEEFERVINGKCFLASELPQPRSTEREPPQGPRPPRATSRKVRGQIDWITPAEDEA